jgi:hypothetical protein
VARIAEKKTSIEQQLDAAPVRYEMNCNALQIGIKDKRVVQLKDGTFERIPNDGFKLHRGGHREQLPYTDLLDPNKAEHAKIIARVDKWIEDNPGPANSVDIAIRKIVVLPDTSLAPIPSWNTLSADRIAGIVKDAELDVVQCAAYEKANKNRPEVFKALDELYKPGTGKVDADSDLSF